MKSFTSLLQKNSLDAVPGPPVRNCGSRSRPGSNGPTTDDDAAADKRHSAG
jgi:hypothetical protein